MGLTVVSNPICGGDITYEPEPTKGKYYPDEIVTLQATPRPGYVFQGWSDNVEGIADATAKIVIVVMSGHRMMTANFTPPSGTITYPVSVETSPSGDGSVTVLTPCGSFSTDTIQKTISIRCLAGAELNLTATALGARRFAGWTGDLSDSGDNVTLLVNSPKAITANFALVPEPTPFPWRWVAVGIPASIALAALVALILIKLLGGRANRAKDPQSPPL